MEKLRVHRLGLLGEAKHGLGLVTLLHRLGDHGRVHLRKLVGLARDRGLEVLGRGADAAHVREVGHRVDGLGLGGRAEELGDLRVAVFFALLAKARYLRLAWLSPAKAV